MANRPITKMEMLLAVAMSEYKEITHVHFIPPGTNYIAQLTHLKKEQYIELLESEFYKLTPKAHKYIQRQSILHFKTADKQIDTFVDNL